MSVPLNVAATIAAGVVAVAVAIWDSIDKYGSGFGGGGRSAGEEDCE